MDSTTLNARVAAGYAKAASIVGARVQQYRPTTSAALGTAIGAVTAAFDQSNRFDLVKPWDRKKAQGYCLTDLRALALGDYLVGADTYFVQRIEPFRPVEVVLCNRVISISAPSGDQTTMGGIVGYQGAVAGTTPVATGWPCAVLIGGRAETDPTRLPADARAPGWEFLLPAIPSVTITHESVLTDDLGRSFLVSAAELTAWGWRLIAGEQVT